MDKTEKEGSYLTFIGDFQENWTGVCVDDSLPTTFDISLQCLATEVCQL